MNKEEALTQIECIVVGTKSLTDKQHQQIRKVLDEYATEVSREIFKAGYGAGILYDENNPNVHSQEKRAWGIYCGINQEESK